MNIKNLFLNKFYELSFWINKGSLFCIDIDLYSNVYLIHRYRFALSISLFYKCFNIELWFWRN